MAVPTSAGSIDTAYLTPLLRTHLDDPGLEVDGVRCHPMRAGTSSAQLHRVTVAIAGRGEPVRLLMKVDRQGSTREARFYRELASQLPIATPQVLDTRVLPDDRGWVLMEELPPAKPGTSWTRDDVHTVVADMAALHGACWGASSTAAGAEWLPRPSEQALAEEVEELRSHAAAIEATGLARIAPDVVGARRLDLICSVLDEADSILGSLLAPGTTLVHGDYWFHNVRVLGDGRRVLIDWQSCRLFSGIWELVYFLDLWHVLGKRSFREHLPEPEERVAAWYADALRGCGVSITEAAFHEALVCARIWQPLAHWLPQLGVAAARLDERTAWRFSLRVPPVARAALTTAASSSAIRFLAATWDRWEERARAHLSGKRASRRAS